jgi:hypothetical protein
LGAALTKSGDRLGHFVAHFVGHFNEAPSLGCNGNNYNPTDEAWWRLDDEKYHPSSNSPKLNNSRQNPRVPASKRSPEPSKRPNWSKFAEARLQGVQVQRVLNPQWLMIGTARENQILVRVGRSDELFRIGDRVDIWGVLQSMPERASLLGLRPTQTQLAEQQDLYIAATRIDVAAD